MKRRASAPPRAVLDFIETLGPFDAVSIENHSVPVSHLSVFTDTRRENGRFWSYDRKAPAVPKHLSPRSVAKQNRLYLIEHEVAPAEIPRDFFERLLARHVEGRFPTIRNKLVYGLEVGILPSLSNRGRFDLAVFMAVQQIRTPAHWRRLEWMGAVHATFEARTQLEAALCGAGVEGMTLQQIRQTIRELDRDDLMVVPRKEHWLATILMVAYRMAPMVAALPWRLVRASGDVEFVTSDTPVVTVIRAPGRLEYSVGGGWADPTCETVFALSPTHVLTVGPNVDRDSMIGSPEWCATVRDRTIVGADRFVFARSESPRVSELLSISVAPDAVIEVNGRQFPTGGSVADVVKQLLKAPEGTIVRWGPPRRVTA